MPGGMSFRSDEFSCLIIKVHHDVGAFAQRAWIGRAEPVQSLHGLELYGDVTALVFAAEYAQRAVLFSTVGRRSYDLRADHTGAFFHGQITMNPAADSPTALGLFHDLLILDM